MRIPCQRTGQLIEAAEAQFDTALINQCAITPSGLSEHDARMVDSDNVTRRPGCGSSEANGHAGAETELKDSVTLFDVKERQRPPVALQVGATMRHDPACQGA